MVVETVAETKSVAASLLDAAAVSGEFGDGAVDVVVPALIVHSLEKVVLDANSMGEARLRVDECFVV